MRIEVHALRVLAMLGLVSTILLMGCSDEESEQDKSAQLSGEVRIAGSSTVYPVSAAMAEEFSRMHRDVNVPVQSTGTGAGFSNFFIPGNTDINDASRTIKESELVAARENGIEPLEFQVAIDALTVAVNPNADWIENVTFNELTLIWGPNGVDRWNQVREDWPAERLELYGPSSASGTFDFFTEVVIGEEDSHRSDYQATEQDNTIIQAVSGSEYSIGYLGFAYYQRNENSVKALRVNDVFPTVETAKSGDYPLARPLYIYVARESLAQRQVREFVRFYLNNIDGELIQEIGYVPMTTEDKNAALNRLEEAIAEVTEQ